MKNLFATAFIILTVSLSSVSFAGSKPFATNPPTDQVTTFAPVVFVKSQATKLDVIVKKGETSRLIIRVLNSQGQTLSTKVIGKNESGTRIRFDLADLQDGAYHIKVTDGQNTQVQEITLDSSIPAAATYRNISLS